MKNIFSLLACCIIGAVLLQQRISYPREDKPPMVTTWDALGYYMYLPGLIIYKDVTLLQWFPAIDQEYNVSGGDLYQAGKQDNGKYVFKYLGGVALIQAPLFLAAHFVAKQTGYPADGFSPPYQYAIAYGALLYCFLALLLLRKILLAWFSDAGVSITLLLLCLATNFVQYVAVDGGMSHAFIFPLYVLVLYTISMWHQKPSGLWAALTGYIIGLATICRPTEAVMLVIPLLWGTHTKGAAKHKWQMVKKHKPHIYLAVFFGILGILPQLLYWKIATGSLIYDVGSKWSFLNPFFRVLFGWEKGWFIYTPVTILFIAGLFFIKKFPFKNAITWFCILNIYIIISWFDWQYGASYSTRALVQSYPVFALPLAAVTEKLHRSKWRFVFYLAGIYLVVVNLFQVKQYNRTVIHYSDMNRRYYSRIYLDPSPTPLDMSLLDTDEMLHDEERYTAKTLVRADTAWPVAFAHTETGPVAECPLIKQEDQWLKIECRLRVPGGAWGSYLHAEIRNGDSVKQTRIRLHNPISQGREINNYAFYMQVPEYFSSSTLKLYISAANDFSGTVENINITGFVK